MNQHDQMREALRQNVRAFRHIKTGAIQYTLGNELESDWEDVMIIPNVSNEVLDTALAAEPAPLVRLERRDIMKICQEAELEYRHGGHRNMADIVAVKVMDAMERLNGQPTASEHRDYRVKTQAPKRPLPPPTTEKI